MNIQNILQKYNIGKNVSYTRLTKAFYIPFVDKIPSDIAYIDGCVTPSNRPWSSLENNNTANFLIETDKGKYILKLFKKEFHRKFHLTFEIELLRILKGLPIITIINSKEGPLVKYQDIHCYLYNFIEGRNLTEREQMINDTAIVRQVANFLRLFHSKTEDLILKDENLRVKEKDIRKSIYEQIPSNLKYKERLLTMNFSNCKKGIIHFDISFVNVIFKNNKLKGVIDWDTVFYGPLVLDLGSICFIWGSDNLVINKEKVKAIIETYKYTESKEQLINAMILKGFHLITSLRKEAITNSNSSITNIGLSKKTEKRLTKSQLLFSLANKIHKNICKIIETF